MKTIPLGGKVAAGRVALIDDEDCELVAGYGWCAARIGRTLYAQAYVRGSGAAAPVYVRMHKLITGWPQTDHINGNGLDNRRANLRPASQAQNQANQRPRRGGSSQYKGVYWHPSAQKWAANIQVSGRARYLGVFIAEEDAARAYDAAATEAFGSYAFLNFPELANPAAGKIRILVQSGIPGIGRLLGPLEN